MTKKGDLEPADTRPGGFWRYLPNNFVEPTIGVQDTVPTYDSVVARNYHAFGIAGKVATLFQYVVIIVGVIAIVTARALQGAEVSFTTNKPSYIQYLKLAQDGDVLNLECTTTNTTLTYGAFSELTFEQSSVCDTVVEDLKLQKLNDARYGPGDGGYVPKSQMGNTSACKTTASRTNMCNLIKENCETGKVQLDALVNRILSASLISPTAATNEFLSKTLSIQTNLTFQASLDSARESLRTTRKWAADNMPTIYGYMQMHANAIQALRLSTGDDSTLSGAINTECARASGGLCSISDIGDGQCDDHCNIAECLFDGSDCIDFEQLESSGPNVKYTYDATLDDYVETYNGYAALALGNVLRTNSDYTWCGPEGGANTNWCMSHAVLSLQTNAIQSFDVDTCANPATWVKRRLVNRTETQIQSEIQWANYTQFADFFRIDNVTIPSNKPPGNPPYQTTDAFTCDRHYNAFTKSSYPSVSADTLWAWFEHMRDASRKVVDACNGNDPAFSDCTLTNLLTVATSDVQWFMLELKLGSIINTAIENSGTLLELGLDASLKRNASGYAVFPTVNHTKYYEFAGVTSCTYTKKLRPEPAAVVTVVLGVIGGITTVSKYVGIVVYTLGKRQIVKRDASRGMSTP